MNYTIESIAAFCGGKASITFPGSEVGGIIIDHRSSHVSRGLFVALKGSRFNGHDFIPELIDRNVHHFIVTDASWVDRYKDRANFIVVDNAVEALQRIAEEHRANYSTEVIAITGSNGKTIVKEWLNTLIEHAFKLCRSPKSYNSQIGVPLSVFEMNGNDTLALFEAGISMPGEMERLHRILRPNYGIFTNLGDAHAAHFESDEHKFKEKWRLFDGVFRVVACKDQAWTRWLEPSDEERCYFWSTKDPEAKVFVRNIDRHKNHTALEVVFRSENYRFTIPFTERINIENAMHCFTMLCILDVLDHSVLERFELLSPVSMRMEVKQGIEETLLIDDTYNADIQSLRASIDQLSTHADRDKWVILSNLSDSINNEGSYKEIAQMLKQADVTRVIGIGGGLEKHHSEFEPVVVRSYLDVDSFWDELNPKDIRHKAILIKGSRKFKLEKLVNRLQAKQRITTLEIDLKKLEQNLKFFQSKLSPGVKTMVMVKAFSYGSGSFEIAHFLEQQKKVDYLVVAYTDEGLALRAKGVNLPIMVLSPSNTSYETMLQHNIEPEIYSVKELDEFLSAAKSLRHLFDVFPIHLKVNTGMNRLGFDEADFPSAVERIKQCPFVRVASIFTHLSASDAEEHDAFTHQQVARFNKQYSMLSEALGYEPFRHVLNSNGVLRFPEYQFECVRLGIGLYGFGEHMDARFLNALGLLKSYIVQIREVGAGESVGYSRQGVAHHSRRIATVGLGYADGLNRGLGNGRWSLKWQGQACTIVGNVCMDMCMIDVTETKAKEGDEVVIFDGSEDIMKMAKVLGTIPYEILTSIPERVRRTYLQE